MAKYQQLKKKLKRQDFIFEDGWFQTLLRKPGQLVMQQFQISDCQQCKIALIDSSANVYIDQSKYCWVFIGPCESTVFVRDCEGMTIVCATKQFRMRDCKNCKIALWCESQPIVQSSCGLQFDCFPNWGYNQMRYQFEQCKMNVWNNHWFDIFDFTPKQPQNFTYRILTEKQMGLENFLNALKISETSMQKKIIPKCLGKKKGEILKDYLVLIYSSIDISTNCQQFIESRISFIPDAISDKIKIQSFENKPCLFLKVKTNSLNFWNNHCKDDLVKIIKNQETLALFDELIFVPFRDEH